MIDVWFDISKLTRLFKEEAPRHVDGGGVQLIFQVDKGVIEGQVYF